MAGEITTVHAIHSSDDGTTWSAPQAVAHTKGTSDHPFLVGRDRRAYLSWFTTPEGYRLIPLG